MTPQRHSAGDQPADDSSSTSLTLLDRARREDPEAWRRLVQLYGPTVFGWCRQSALQASDAADIVQEVFRAVWAGIGGLRKDRPADSFRGWLWTITRNKLRDHLRRCALRPVAPGGTDAYQQLQQLPDVPREATRLEEDRSLTHRALQLIRAEFEDRTWEAFWASAVEGCSADDIARDLGMTKGAVRQAKYRVLQRLRQDLCDPDEPGKMV